VQTPSIRSVRPVEVPNDVYLQADELIFPSFLSTRTLNYLPKVYLDDLLPHVLPKRPRQKRHRIFIARKIGTRGALRLIENENALISRLNQLGFKKYYLEDLSLGEQIELFYDAQMVVAAHGAGLSNLIFADDIDVIELHASAMVIPTYYYLSISLGHRYQYWKGFGRHFEDNFSVDVDAVTQLLNLSERQFQPGKSNINP